MSTTIDQQFIEYIVKALVGNPDAVSIERTIDEKGVLLQLTVDPEDLGRVIGKRGSGAQALRTLLRALGTKNDARYNLKIVDVNGGDRPERPARDERDESPRDELPKHEDAHQEKVEAVEPEEDEMEAAQPPEEEPQSETLSFADDEEDSTEESGDSSLADKTRRELADLDDLDI